MSEGFYKGLLIAVALTIVCLIGYGMSRTYQQRCIARPWLDLAYQC